MIYLPRRTIGGFTIYQRKPKPLFGTRYCIGTGPVKDLLDFKSYAKAMEWIKRRKQDEELYELVLGRKM